MTRRAARKPFPPRLNAAQRAAQAAERRAELLAQYRADVLAVMAKVVAWANEIQPGHARIDDDGEGTD